MQFTVDSSVVIFPVLIVWLCGTTILHLKGRYQPTLLRHLVESIFIVYLLMLIHYTVFPIRVHLGSARDEAVFRESINLIPFEGLRQDDFILNILMTVPLGLLLPIVMRRFPSASKMLAIAVCVALLFKVTQLILRVIVANDRYVDMNDVIANGAGVLIGFGLAKLAVRDDQVRNWASATLLR